MVIATSAAATISAEFVGGKATRDGLFLTALDVTSLPMMLVATSICSIGLAALYGRGSRRVIPAVLVPLAATGSGLLFLAEWLIRSIAPLTTAVSVFLHISVVIPILASGFWLIAGERFDPRAAKRLFGRIAAAGTLGGLAGAVIAERLAALYGAPSMLICLAVFQFAFAALVRLLAISDTVTRRTTTEDDQAPSFRANARVLTRAPHLRNLMTLVLLGTIGAALVDYLFKAQAVEAFGRGDSLLRFFSIYYAATSLVSFALQTFGSRAILERFGLGLSTASPSIALAAGSLASLVTPGFGSLLVARGGEASLRGSWFRAGYELFYTPLAAAERRAAKSVIDVALDRVGDAVGGGLVRLVITVVPSAQPVLLAAAAICSAGAIVAASQLNRWYLRTLESSLRDQAGDLDLSDTKDGATSRVLLELRHHRPGSNDTTRRPDPDALVEDIAVLRHGSDEAVLTVLFRENGLARPLVSHVLPLLASDTLGDYAVFALRKVAEEHAGELTDALLDPNQPRAVRIRLARVFSVGVSQRSADGLMASLDDPEPEVRIQAVKSLNAIVEKNALVTVDRKVIERVVLNEIELARPIWENQRIEANRTPLDRLLNDRGDRSVAHIFALLSLILSREPLQIAYRSLHSEDHHLRGTALEYLEGVLPSAIRANLWPFLVYRRRPAALPLADLVARIVHPRASRQANLAAPPTTATPAGFSTV
jgi:ATP:ADP antiporter, AAA family